MKYLIGTRGSKLALVQASLVCDKLKKEYPEHEFEIKVIQTKGDKIQDKPLNQIGAKGLFVKEIEAALLSGEIQLGVHSMKDMPSRQPEGLVFASPWKREDPRDVLVLRKEKSLAELPEGAVIGTGSKRREFQLKKLRPDLNVVGIRGNIDTRLRKMEEQKLDGLVLAAAGLHRLGMEKYITEYFDVDVMIPAPAQGVLALELREDNTELLSMLESFRDEETAFAAAVEREFLYRIGGDCHVPVGAVCYRERERYRMNVMFGDEQGQHISYGELEGTDVDSMAGESIRLIRGNCFGTVYLVGGGPGDSELITVKGRNLLREADCIIYDRLSSPALLEEAKPECEKIYAGKENHHHTMAQEEINKLLIQKASEYRRVVRLKGGDPYVFGRGGEEALALRGRDIPFEIIPGVTSAVAGPAYAGIPVTHRGLAGGFRVVTAHNCKDELADIDFASMAKGTETLVFLMGLGKVQEIADGLLRAGMSGNTKVAVISQASTERQKTCTGTLADIAEKVKKAKLESPAVIAVGEVVSLQKSLEFVSEKRKWGRRCLVTKIGQETSRLTKKLREQGACVDEIQVGEIIPKKIDISAGEIACVDWIVFTSRHGVEEFFTQLAEACLDVRLLSHCRIATVGAKTAEALKKKGLYPDLQPARFDSDALAEALYEQLTGKETVWYIKAENTENHLKGALGDKCHMVEKTVYENRAVRFSLPEGIEAYDSVYFTCASSVRRLIKKMGNRIPEKWQREDCVYSIGPKCTSCLKEYGVSRVLEANRATCEALAER